MSPWENCLLCWQIPILLTFFLGKKDFFFWISFFPKETCSHLPFIRVTVHLEKGNSQDWRELLNTGAELTPIPGDQKSFCCLQSQSKDLYSQRSGDQWSFGLPPTRSGPSEYSYPPGSYFSIFRMYNLNRCTQQLAEFLHCFPDYNWSYSGKAWGEVTRTASTLENNKQKSMPHSWRDFRD